MQRELDRERDKKLWHRRRKKRGWTGRKRTAARLRKENVRTGKEPESAREF